MTGRGGGMSLAWLLVNPDWVTSAFRLHECLSGGPVEGRSGPSKVVGSELPWERLADEGLSLSDVLAAGLLRERRVPAVWDGPRVRPATPEHGGARRFDEAV